MLITRLRKKRTKRKRRSNGMKILAVNGSPRKGNSDAMLDVLLGSAREHGAETEIVYLREKKLQFCSGGDDCCPVKKECHIKDDMPEIYKKLENAGIIILASPCYFFNVTARMKNFMDRCNPYYFNKRLKGKKFFLLSVGGYEASIKGAIDAMKNFVGGVHGKVIGSYSAVADKSGSLEKNQKVIKELKEIGKKINK